MINKLTLLLNEQLGLNMETAQLLTRSCEMVAIKKGDFLVAKAVVPVHYYFVESGLLRYYSADVQGREYTIQFATENWFVGDYAGEIKKETPARFFIQALEGSRLIKLDAHFIAAVFNMHRNMLDVSKFFSKIILPLWKAGLSSC